MQEDDRPAGGDRRRAPARLVAHGLHLPARRRREARRPTSRSSSATRAARSVFTPPSMRVDGAGAARAHDLRRRLRVPARQRHDGRAEADDPVAEHGALPRRPARRSTRRSTPTSTSSGPTSRPPTASEIARLGELGCRYLQLDDTSLAYLNDPKQREHVAEHRRRSRAPARGLHPPPQRGASRAGPTGMRDHDAHVPRQLPLVVVRLGRLRVRRRGAAQRARRWTASSWSSTTSARAASSRCASCRPASSSCSAS